MVATRLGTHHRPPVGMVVIAVLLGALLVWILGCNPIAPTPTSSPLNPSPVTTGLTAIAVVPSPGELGIGGGNVSLWIETSAAPGVGAPGVALELEASAGDVSPRQVTTDRTGHATATWSGTSTATITAHAGDVVGTGRIPVSVPQELPPPSKPLPPRPPEPEPPPLPPPPQPPDLIVTLSSNKAVAAVGTPVMFTAAVSGNTDPIAAYSWDFNGDGVSDATTLVPTRTYAFTVHGVMVAKVVVLTLGGRQASGTARIVITN